MTTIAECIALQAIGFEYNDRLTYNLGQVHWNDESLVPFLSSYFPPREDMKLLNLITRAECRKAHALPSNPIENQKTSSMGSPKSQIAQQYPATMNRELSND